MEGADTFKRKQGKQIWKVELSVGEKGKMKRGAQSRMGLLKPQESLGIYEGHSGESGSTPNLN